MKKFIFILISLIVTVIPFNYKNNEEEINQNNCMIKNEIISNEIEAENSVITEKTEEVNENVIEKSDVIMQNNTKSVEIVQNNAKQSIKEEQIIIEEEVKEEEIIEQEEIKQEEEQQETIIEPIEQKEEIIPEVIKKNGYYYNEEATNLLVSEFKRITNYDSNFNVRIDEKARNTNPFYPYRESQIEIQVCNLSFGNFIVYAEDFYKDDVKQRTLYYITFDV